MSKKQLMLVVLISSFIGGVLSVIAFVFLLRPKNYLPYNDLHYASFTNYTLDSSQPIPAGLNFVYAANAATPAVVHIRSFYKMEDLPYQQNPFEELFKDRFGNKNSFPMQLEEEGKITPQGSGSGVVIAEDGYIVTNYHVVAEAEKIEVILHDKRSYAGTLVGADASTDLAVIKIKEKRLIPIQFGNSDELQIGSWVLAVGNPFNLTSTVTAGIISAKARSINVFADQMAIESFIQTDAVINPGNSGGALVNLKGELVGINTAIASTSGTFAGYAFAIPVSLVEKIAEDIRTFGVVQRAVLGVSVINLNAELAKEKGIKDIVGVYIDSVALGSAAERGGLKSGDVIMMINDASVNYASRLQEVVATYRPGDKIVITFIRNNKIRKTDVTLKNERGGTASYRK